MERKKTNKQQALHKAVSQFLALRLLPNTCFMENDFLYLSFDEAAHYPWKEHKPSKTHYTKFS